MGIYYPQASMIMRIRWEDFNDSNSTLLKEVYDIPILARSVTVNINDYTQADTFDCEIDYKEFPFDPRCIRSCGVTIYMQDMERVFQASNKLEQIRPSQENDVFVGFADEESISFNDDKRTVKLEGRDYTALLIDKKYPKGTIDLEQRIDVVLSGILSELEQTKDIKLDNKIEGELPTLASFWAEKGKLSGKKNVKQGETYWDVIQDIVSRAGLIAYIELDKLVLSKPRVLYDKDKSKRFVYGKNLKNLEFKRKIGRKKNFNIIVRSLDIEKKEVLEAKIPLEATAEWSNATNIPNVEVKARELKPDGTEVAEADAKPSPYIAFRVADVASKDQLIVIGQEIFEEIGRQQIEGSFETYEMETMQVDKKAFDVLKLRVGHPLSIEIDQGDMKGLSRITSVTERRRFLIAHGYNEKVAGALAETLGKFATPFYTKAVTFTMDGENGWKCKVDFINFIETTNKAFAGRV